MVKAMTKSALLFCSRQNWLRYQPEHISNVGSDMTARYLCGRLQKCVGCILSLSWNLSCFPPKALILFFWGNDGELCIYLFLSCIFFVCVNGYVIISYLCVDRVVMGHYTMGETYHCCLSIGIFSSFFFLLIIIVQENTREKSITWQASLFLFLISFFIVHIFSHFASEVVPILLHW